MHTATLHSPLVEDAALELLQLLHLHLLLRERRLLGGRLPGRLCRLGRLRGA